MKSTKYNRIFTISYLMLLFTIVSSCLKFDKTYQKLPPGTWRGVLYLDGKIKKLIPFEKKLYKKQDVLKYEVGQNQLPFIFEVKYIRPDSFIVVLINGEERIPLDDIRYGRNPVNARDTLHIGFPLYNTWIRAVHEQGLMEGDWIVPARGDYRIEFGATYGEQERFPVKNPAPIADLSGRWKVRFGIEDTTGKSLEYAIGEFVQKGTHLSGTFMTETGDYRYLEGVVDGDQMKLSAFDGLHAFLFKAGIYGDGSLKGIFKSGKHYTTRWDAVRDEHFQLRDPDTLTKVAHRDIPLKYRFPSSTGKWISLEDPEFENHPVLIQIMGTWCPNCRDESHFLTQYLSEHPGTDLKVIGTAFEKFKDTAQAIQHLDLYKHKMKMPYPLVLGGKLSKDAAIKAFPQLNHIMSYPTMLFLDRKHNIRFVHTGFAGPATSAYPEFKRDFEQKVKEISQ